MEQNPYMLDLLAALLYGVVGLRLAALSAQTRGRPERLLALNYLATGFSYMLYEVPYILGTEGIWVLVAARIVYTLGIVPLLLFTYAVFRRNSRWASVLIWANSTVLFSGVFLSLLEGDIEGLDVSSFWFWCDWIGYTVPYVWIAVEGWISYRSAKRRVLLGLGAPDVAHRFLLWAWFGALSTLAGISLIPLYAQYAATGTWSAWSDYTSGLEFAATVVLWLAFFPPKIYRNYVSSAVETLKSY